MKPISALFFLFSLLSIGVVSGNTQPDTAQPSDQSMLDTLFCSSGPIEATGYDSHVELRWRPVTNADRYAVYRLQASGNPVLRGFTNRTYYLDFVETTDTTYTYRVSALNRSGETIHTSPDVSASVRRFTDDQLQEMVQRYTFRYFWEFADPLTGLIFERSDDSRESCITIGGSGFGIMGLIAGIENGFVTREEVLTRLERIVGSLERLPRFHGVWAHWYDTYTNKAYPFSEHDNGGDLVETAFLIQGLLTAQGYFDRETEQEKTLRARIDTLWHGVEWSFYTQGEKALYWHWSEEHGFAMNHKVQGYDEALIAYILAAASPTYPIDREVYEQCWVNREAGEFFCATDFYGTMLPLGKRALMGGPLFWVHYSYLGLDPRGLRDLYANYWEQNCRFTRINRAYCIDNPYGWVGYGPDFWGLTACDALPTGYMAHSPGIGHDFGTVAPTAALSSMPYTPQESMDVLRNLYLNLGPISFGIMGFYDALNLGMPDPHKSTYNYLAIDQGPILIMIENHRRATLWKAFMKNDDVRRGLSRLGFTYNQSPVETLN